MITEILTATGGAVVALTPTVVVLRRAHTRLQELRTSLSAARYDATHDGLTGVGNRRAFYADAAAAVAAANPERPLGLALVDLNAFKQVNDVHGHGVGDVALIAVAHRLRERAGDNAVVARLGGDEFAVLVPLRRGESAYDLGCALADASDAPIDVTDDVSLSMTWSVGVVHVWTPGDLAVLLAQADAAMYRNKNGAGVTVYHPAADDHTVPIPRQRPAIRTRDLGVARLAARNTLHGTCAELGLPEDPAAAAAWATREQAGEAFDVR